MGMTEPADHELEFPLISILGSLGINGTQYPGRSDMQRRFLAILALNSSKPVEGDVIAQALWGDQAATKPPDAARRFKGHVQSNLQVLLETGREIIRATAGTGAYMLELPPLHIDIHLFHDLLRRARVAEDSGHICLAARLNANALALWPEGTSSPLPDLQNCEQGIHSATQLMSIRPIALNDYVSQRLLLGHDRDLLPLLAAELEKTPTDWRLHHSNIVALCRDQQPEPARIAWQKANIALTEGGDQIPDRLEGMEDRILTNDAELFTRPDADDLEYCDPALLDFRNLPRMRRLAPAADEAVPPPATNRPQTGATQALRLELRARSDRMQRRRMPGSRRAILGDLLRISGLLIDSSATRHNDGMKIPNLLQHLTDDALDQGRSARAYVTSGPGTGKSTVASCLSVRLTELRAEGKFDEIPVLIDLRNYRSERLEPDFGTRAWLARALNLTFFSADDTGHWKDISLQAPKPDQLQLSPFVILDSIDELLAGLSPAQSVELLNRDIFRLANVSCVRSLFFQQNIEHSALALSGPTYELALWDEQQRRSYTQSYCQHFFGEDGVAWAEELLYRMEANASLRAVCSVPIRLNMALDLADTGHLGDLPAYISASNLYRVYITNLLGMEATRAGSVLDAEQKLALLTHVAWHFYDEGGFGETSTPAFTQDELRRCLAEHRPELNGAELSHIVDDIATRTLLEPASTASGVSSGQLNFAHKSFQEHLVALKFTDSVSQSAEATAMVSKSYFSPEVAEFIKESLSELGASRRISGLASASIIGAFRALERETQTDPRVRIGKEQIYYYGGNLATDAVIEFQRRQVENETDPWLKHGLIIGLAFGGYPEFLQKYVEVLREEAASGGPTPLNDLNLSTQFTYFGDAAFDPQNPEGSLDVESCGKMLSRLAYQLQSPTDRPGWPIDVYSIVALCRRQGTWTASVDAALAGNIAVLSSAIDQLSEHPEASKWPEVDDLRDILQPYIQGET